MYAILPHDVGSYSYAGMSYANSHGAASIDFLDCLTQTATRTATTTSQYTAKGERFLYARRPAGQLRRYPGMSVYV